MEKKEYIKFNVPNGELIFNGEKFGELIINNSNFETLKICNSEINLVKISDSEINRIIIEESVGVNWVIYESTINNIFANKLFCKGDLAIIPDINYHATIKNCSSEGQFDFWLSGYSNEKVYIDGCKNLKIRSSGANTKCHIEVFNSDFGFDFRESKFGGDILIKNNVFTLKHEGKKFVGKLRFYNLFCENDYYGDWSFKDCIFDGVVKINECVTESLTSIVDCTFSKGSSFTDTKFLGDVSFAGTKFKREAVFRKSRFLRATFQGAEFSAPSDFSQCRFDVPPQFFGASLHQGATFLGTVFKEPSNIWLPWGASRDRWYSDVHAALLAFRALKGHMAKIKSQGDELIFFSHEMRMERKLTGWLSNPMLKILSIIYDLVSVYGSSPGRAAIWLFFWNIIFYGLFNLLGFAYNHPIGYNFPINIGVNYSDIAIVDAGIFTGKSIFENNPIISLVVQNAINPVAIVSQKSLVSTKSWLVFWLSILQSVGVVAIAALLVLAIRSRFQKGSGGSEK